MINCSDVLRDSSHVDCFLVLYIYLHVYLIECYRSVEARVWISYGQMRFVFYTDRP